MKTLRPYDFFLNEDAPAVIDQTSGLLSVKLVESPDCFIGAAIPVPDSWSGTSMSVRLHVRSTGVADTSAGFRVYAHAWPSSPSEDGPIAAGAIMNVRLS